MAFNAATIAAIVMIDREFRQAGARLGGTRSARV
jgi:hypothetical protein